jgi:ribose 1,5-bisphosphokinase
MSGTWVFVCGPSGAGKDSVIDWARRTLGPRSDIVFAQRLITRPAQEGSDHQPVSGDDFRFLRESAAFAWHWEAHGFGYAIPQRYAHQVAWGRIVVVNGSREHVESVPPRSGVRRVLVSAPAHQLASRLAGRRRDEPEAIATRLARNAQLAAPQADLVIENTGTLHAAGAALVRFLASLTQRVG